jgi:hypothetical protein
MEIEREESGPDIRFGDAAAVQTAFAAWCKRRGFKNETLRDVIHNGCVAANKNRTHKQKENR